MDEEEGSDVVKEKKKKDLIKSKKIRRSCFLALTVAFFGFAAGITVYSVKRSAESCPAVTVTGFTAMDLNGESYSTAVPRQALYPEEMEMAYHLFSVGQKKGPWGEEYYAVRHSVLCPDEWYDNEELEKVPVICMDTVEGPVILEHEGELYAGERIRVTGELGK